MNGRRKKPADTRTDEKESGNERQTGKGRTIERGIKRSWNRNGEEGKRERQAETQRDTERGSEGD